MGGRSGGEGGKHALTLDDSLCFTLAPSRDALFSSTSLSDFFEACSKRRSVALDDIVLGKEETDAFVISSEEHRARTRRRRHGNYREQAHDSRWTRLPHFLGYDTQYSEESEYSEHERVIKSRGKRFRGKRNISALSEAK